MTDPTPERLDLASLDIAAEKVARLREDFPEVFEDGRINFEALRRALGEWVDPGKERFGLTWPGKAACMRTIQQPSYGTLRPDRAESVDFDSTQNVIIEGENLEVLKLLQKSYYGKVKMIYIDPPYNTGQDFVYPDDYSEPLNNYMLLTGQVDEAGTRITSNVETGGRYHTNWLNMMYPRLFLARNLLRENGIILVMIDDHEVDNLRLLMDEVFGEENFVVQIPWQARTSVQNDTDISDQHEYVVCYARIRRKEHRRLKESNIQHWHTQLGFAFYPLPLDPTRFSNPDGDPRGPWKADPFDAPNVRPNLTYEIVNPRTGSRHLPPPGRCWRTEPGNFAQLLTDNRILFGQSGDGRPQLKVFYEEKRDYGEVPTTWFDGGTYGTATGGTRVLQDLFDGVSPFDTPKPPTLVQKLLEIGTRNNDLILDFFAGSGTTAHAVMKQNVADGGNRRYILVQLPEPTEGEYPTISAITRERVRRAGAAIAAERAGKLDLDGSGPLDLGFRAYHLAESNLYITPPSDVGLPGTPDERASQPALFADPSRTPSPVQIELFADNIRPGRSGDDLLTQILLSTGYELTAPVERLHLGAGEVFSVSGGDLLVCLSRSLTMEVIEAMVSREPAQIICLDVGFGGNDALKVNAVQAIKARGKSQLRVL